MGSIVDTTSNVAFSDFSSESITLIRHLPNKPAASEKYKDDVIFDKNDTCFYRCRKVDDNWEWQKVTYGYKRNFLIPVATLSNESTFDEIVDLLNAVVVNLNVFYGYAFEPVDASAYGSNEEAVVEKFNELVDFVNGVCNVPSPLQKATLKSASADTLSDIVPKMNAFIFIINPAAAAISLVRDISKVEASASAAVKASAIVNSAKQQQLLADQFIGV